MTGRKNEEQIGEVRVLDTHRGRPMPNLSAGECICPVCEQSGVKLPPDGKPGIRFNHAGRNVVCRDLEEE